MATIHAALDAGIDLLDTAPLYESARAIVGETFGGTPAARACASRRNAGSARRRRARRSAMLTASLEASLKTMRLERVDIFFLHSNICADDYVYAVRPDRQDTFATRWSVYEERSHPGDGAPARRRARSDAGASPARACRTPIVCAPSRMSARPAWCRSIDEPARQRGQPCAGYAEPARPREIIATREGTRRRRDRHPRGAGRRADRRDRPRDSRRTIRTRKDYERAAPFRALCRESGEDPALCRAPLCARRCEASTRSCSA